MRSQKKKPAVDFSTEEKIKNAARTIFHKKGYAATRTRDIAEEAGINLALLNYYFRSKEKLFDIIMLESLQSFRQSMVNVLNDKKTSLENKIETLVNNYLGLLIAQPEIPLFVLSELRANPTGLLLKMNPEEILMKSYFVKQFQQGVKEGKITNVHPVHFIVNILGLAIFPFIGRPLVIGLGGIKPGDFEELMKQRKILIPKWIKAMLKAK